MLLSDIKKFAKKRKSAKTSSNAPGPKNVYGIGPHHDHANHSGSAGEVAVGGEGDGGGDGGGGE